MGYRQLAQAAMAKSVGYDPYFPAKSDVMISAWAEALEDGGITEMADVLMAVRVMYRNHGDPGWHPTPRVLVATAQEVKKLRLERERKVREETMALEGPPRYTYREFKERHPDVEFKRFGKSIPTEGESRQGQSEG
jgi:hypothetical protein